MKENGSLSRFDKYIELAKSLGAVHAKIISSKDNVFDILATLTCNWRCEYFFRVEQSA